MSKQESNRGMALDTCVIRRMRENLNYVDMLSTLVNLRGVEVHACSRVVDELKRQGIAVGPIADRLEGLGARVVFEKVDALISADAKAMEARRAPLLHWPDSDILAHAKARSIVLLTCDRDLEAVAGMEGVEVVNPDKLCGADSLPRSPYESADVARARRLPARPGRAAAPVHKRGRRHLHRRAAPLRA